MYAVREAGSCEGLRDSDVEAAQEGNALTLAIGKVGSWIRVGEIHVRLV